MAGQLSIQPPELDLALYAGDGIKFKLICTDDADPPAPVNVTGTVEAQIRPNRDEDAPLTAEFAADMVGADAGEIILSLTGAQTQALMVDPSVSKGKFAGVWDIQWTATDGEPRTLCQGKVECIADVSR
jgi:hypothetical protein